MNVRWKSSRVLAGAASAVLFALMFAVQVQTAGAQTAQAGATATITIVVPADAVLFFDGDHTTQTGTERRFTTPVLEKGMKFHYNVQARWNVNGKSVERSRRVPVTAGARVRISLLEDEKPAAAKGKDSEKDKQVVTSKASKRVPAATINFRKAFGLPLDSLGTLGSRIDAARRKPDPVALAHAASELKVAEKVSGKTASLTSKALLAESAELATLRRQVAELRAVAAVHQQVANEETNVAFWKNQIAMANQTVQQELDAVRRNELPTDAPRKVLLNNYTTQYIDLWINGNYKMQVPPGGSKWCVIEHKWSPTVLTAYGDQDDSPTWGPRNIYGTFKTYTWNIE